MHVILWLAGALALVLILYLFVVRPWLKRQPWAASFFAWIEPIEAKLWLKSRSVFMARLMSVGGAIVALYNSLSQSAIDWSGLQSTIISHLPEGWRGLAQQLVLPIMVMIVGVIFEWLRHVTTTSLQDK